MIITVGYNGVMGGGMGMGGGVIVMFFFLVTFFIYDPSAYEAGKTFWIDLEMGNLGIFLLEFSLVSMDRRMRKADAVQRNLVDFDIMLV